jgi:hypothetical protein
MGDEIEGRGRQAGSSRGERVRLPSAHAGIEWLAMERTASRDKTERLWDADSDAELKRRVGHE